MAKRMKAHRTLAAFPEVGLTNDRRDGSVHANSQPGPLGSGAGPSKQEPRQDDEFERVDEERDQEVHDPCL